ncbi:hypothetical protein ACVW0Q_001277 [Thermostichus sp. MS-CIW-21]|jgi:hypothetical protein
MEKRESLVRFWSELALPGVAVPVVDGGAGRRTWLEPYLVSNNF